MYKPGIVVGAVFAHKGAFILGIMNFVALWSFDRGAALEELIGVGRVSGDGPRKGGMR